MSYIRSVIIYCYDDSGDVIYTPENCRECLNLTSMNEIFPSIVEKCPVCKHYFMRSPVTSERYYIKNCVCADYIERGIVKDITEFKEKLKEWRNEYLMDNLEIGVRDGH